jgi:hypothetical protein
MIGIGIAVLAGSRVPAVRRLQRAVLRRQCGAARRCGARLRRGAASAVAAAWVQRLWRQQWQCSGVSSGRQRRRGVTARGAAVRCGAVRRRQCSVERRASSARGSAVQSLVVVVGDPLSSSSSSSS